MPGTLLVVAVALSMVPLIFGGRLMARPKMGRLVWVPNKNPRPGEAKGWWSTKLEKKGKEFYALITEYELRRPTRRAARNRKDVARVGWFRDLGD